MEMMRAWAASTRSHVVQVDKPRPHPSRDEVLVRVVACGVCRTDLHVVDRELPVHAEAVTPGHQAIGTVEELGSAVERLKVGDTVGIAWLRRTCGTCAWCRSGRENLCPDSQYNGWDADGGYAEYATVPEAYAYLLEDGIDPVATAPLLCAGIVGYRALTRAALPPAGRLGIYGFGSSAHVTAQVAVAGGAELFVATRGDHGRDLARAMGASFVGDENATFPVPMDSVIVFAPAGELVPRALESTTRGGTVVLAGIHMSQVPAMDYRSHLFLERDLRTVTSNTRSDGDAFLKVAHALRIEPSVTAYPFERADEALEDLRRGAFSGTAVVMLNDSL